MRDDTSHTKSTRKFSTRSGNIRCKSKKTSHHHLPSFGGRDCWVRYDGQPRTCIRCGQTGHDAKECRVVRCYRCQKEGYVSGRCTEDPLCTICGESGHSPKSCPLSFANKLKQTNEWVGGGGIAVEGAEVGGRETRPDKEPEPHPAKEGGDAEPEPTSNLKTPSMFDVSDYDNAAFLGGGCRDRRDTGGRRTEVRRRPTRGETTVIPIIASRPFG